MVRTKYRYVFAKSCGKFDNKLDVYNKIKESFIEEFGTFGFGSIAKSFKVLIFEGDYCVIRISRNWNNSFIDFIGNKLDFLVEHSSATLDKTSKYLGQSSEV